MALENIELSDKEQKELREQLESWKQGVIDKVEEDLTTKYEEMESSLKEEYTALVGDIREKMKKVFTKRFVTALKEMYDQIKAEVLAESYDSPDMRILEEIKTLVYPLINGSEAERYTSEFSKLAEMNEELNEELEVTKGQKKLMELTDTLSPEVKKVVMTLIGEGTEEDIVEKFAAIKEALAEAKDDDEEGEFSFDEEPEEEEEKGKKPKKADFDTDEEYEEALEKWEKKKKKKKDEDEEEEPEEREEEPELEEEDIKLTSKTGEINAETEEDEDKEQFNEALQDMLELAGVKKKQRK